MPKTPSRGYWHQAFLWRAANAGMLVRCHCRRCRRMRTYLAADLVDVFGPVAVIGRLWGQCPNCGSRDRWSEQERVVLSDDAGHTVIRRPNGFRHVRLWRDEFFDPVAHAAVKSYGPVPTGWQEP